MIMNWTPIRVLKETLKKALQPTMHQHEHGGPTCKYFSLFPPFSHATILQLEKEYSVEHLR